MSGPATLLAALMTLAPEGGAEQRTYAMGTYVQGHEIDSGNPSYWLNYYVELNRGAADCRTSSPRGEGLYCGYRPPFPPSSELPLVRTGSPEHGETEPGWKHKRYSSEEVLALAPKESRQEEARCGWVVREVTSWLPIEAVRRGPELAAAWLDAARSGGRVGTGGASEAQFVRGSTDRDGALFWIERQVINGVPGAPESGQPVLIFRKNRDFLQDKTLPAEWTLIEAIRGYTLTPAFDCPEPPCDGCSTAPDGRLEGTLTILGSLPPVAQVVAAARTALSRGPLTLSVGIRNNQLTGVTPFRSSAILPSPPAWWEEATVTVIVQKSEIADSIVIQTATTLFAGPQNRAAELRKPSPLQAAAWEMAIQTNLKRAVEVLCHHVDWLDDATLVCAP